MLQDVDITNFTAGELSPRLKGRYDLQQYFNGCETVQNMTVMPQGGSTMRPGTMFAALTQDQAQGEFLIGFIFSETQAYVLGFGNYYIRIYANGGVVTSGGVPVVLVSPYSRAEARQLGWAQSYDTLFLAHPAHPTQLLTRTGATSFAITAMSVRDGPYFDRNTTSTTLSPSGTSGSITVTASSTVGINAGAGFSSADIGRLIRMQVMTTWVALKITSVSSSTVVQATVQAYTPNGAWGALEGEPWAASQFYPVAGIIVKNGANYYKLTVSGTSGTTTGPTGTTAGASIYDGTCVWNYLTSAPPSTTTGWRLSKWGGSNGYPSQVTFWQNRLMLGGSLGQANVLEGSVTGDFTNFAPSQLDGTVSDINALSWLIQDEQNNAVRWLSAAGSAQAMQLGIGASAGENIMQAATTSAALTPSNVQTYRETSLGSAAYIRPQRIGKAVLFWNRTGRKLHEWVFTWQVNGYLGPDLAVLAEHIPRPVPSPPDTQGVIAQAYQQSPHGVLWAVRSDGALIGLTYLRDQNVVGWHRHPLGGQHYGGPPIVESLAVIPSPSGAYDQLWLEVLRTVNGVEQRSIEVMQPYFEGVSPDLAFFVDCGLTTPLTYPSGYVGVWGLTASTDPDRPVTYSGTGWIGLEASLLDTTWINAIVRFNGGKLVITGIVNAIQATVQVLEPLTTLASASAGAWTMTKAFSTVTGLDYLNGETVTILGDGRALGRQVVSGGQVTLPTPATLVTVGLPYTGVTALMPFEPSRAAAAASSGRMKRVHRLYARFHETLGGMFGIRQTDPLTGAETVKLEPIQGRTGGMPFDLAVQVFNGVRRFSPRGGWDREARMLFVQSDPLPMTVLAIAARADVEEVDPQ